MLSSLFETAYTHSDTFQIIDDTNIYLKKDALNNEGRFYLESGATQTSGAASAQTDATKDGFISQEKMYVDHGIIDSESV